jgi:N-acetylmuramoyl-L-alanine amidase
MGPVPRESSNTRKQAGEARMVRQSRTTRKIAFILSIILAAATLTINTYVAKTEAATQAAGVVVTVDGSSAKLSEKPMMKGSKLYVPAGSLAKGLGAKSVRWDGNNEETVIVTAYDDKIVLGNQVPVVYFNGERYVMDSAPFLSAGRMYVPLAPVAELMQATTSWKGAGTPAELTNVKPAIVTADYGIQEMSKEYGVDESKLRTVNGLESSEELREGQAIRVVMPSALSHPAEPYTEADFKLLAKITQVEAGDDSYEGQLAVANVILNRVKSGKFPDSIRAVIYSGKQFPPAHNGLLDKSMPKANALRAAKDALNGKNNVADAVYFYDPDVTGGPFWSSLKVVATIGEHRFAK